MELQRCALLLLVLGLPSADVATVQTDIMARLTFVNGTTVDAAPIIQLALFGPPSRRHFAPAHALGRQGRFLYHPSPSDGGDTACQGAVNVDQIGLLATPDLVPVTRNWLCTAVVRQSGLDNSGQVWSQPGGPYHGFGQGAMEANAELILMAALYASHTGDHALFSTAPERLVCAEFKVGDGAARAGSRWAYVGAGRWTAASCGTQPESLLAAHPQLYNDYAHPPHISAPRGKSKPGLYPGQGTVLVTRVKLPRAASALSLALTSQSANFSICVRDVAGDTVVATVRSGRTSNGWVTVKGQFEAGGAYDVAVQTESVAGQGHGPVAWLSDSSPGPRGGGGGARTEVYDEGEPPRGCCGKVSDNGWPLSLRGCYLPENSSGFDIHRDSITSICGCSTRSTAPLPPSWSERWRGSSP
jgi:hypothetical protein